MAGSTGRGRISADPALMLQAADRLRATARAIRAGPLVVGADAAAGDPALAAALSRFGRTWGGVCAELDDDLTRLADGVALIARAYQDAEAAAAGQFDPIGQENPG
jgi:DNA-binding transcriptional LysR family regulator